MQKMNIVKIGGEIVDAPDRLDLVVQQFISLPGPKILIHGGGLMVSELARRLDIPVRMTDGRRITDAETLRLTAMVYAGLINKSIVAKLQALACPAVGLSGADGQAVLTKRRSGTDIDFGFVGDIITINAVFLTMLIDHGYVPVLCSLTADNTGQLLNTNADTIATETAVAMQGSYDVDLYFLTDKPGILYEIEDDRSVIMQIDMESYTKLKAENRIAGGMLPKIDNGLRAVKLGVEAVYITHYSKLSDKKSGTRLVM